MSSFNAFIQKTIQGFNSGVPVWLGVVSPRPVGGILDAAFTLEGALYPAGCPINLNAGVIKPFVAWEVVSYSSSDKTITVKGNALGYFPAADSYLGAATASSFTAKSKSSKLTSIAADSTEGQWVFTFNDANVPGDVAAGNYLVMSAETSAKSSGAKQIVPNAYLYNDIYIDAPRNARETVDYKKASGAAVDFHGEGLLINRVPFSEFKEALKTAIPNVIMVEY